MPRLSDSMEEGTVLAWMKSVGDEVAVGDELVEIETDKANMVYESDVAGTLVEILADEGATLPIGEVIARVGGDAGDGAARRTRQAGDGGEPRRAEPAAATAAAPPTEGAGRGGLNSRTPLGARAAARRTDGERLKASPIARRIAARPQRRPRGAERLRAGWTDRQGRRRGRRGCRPSRDAGRGRGAAAAAPPGVAERPETARGSAETIELTRLQQTVARRMAESKATAPHFYLTSEIDMTQGSRGAGPDQGRRGRRRGRALVQRHGRQGLRPGAARVPPGQRRLPRRQGRGVLARERRDRGGRPGRPRRPDHLRRRHEGAAADRDRDAAASPSASARGRSRRRSCPGEPSPFPTWGCSGSPASRQSSIRHRRRSSRSASIDEVPVVRDGEIVPGNRMSVNLACDHRVLYGADGARFLARVRDLLEEPVFLAL